MGRRQNSSCDQCRKGKRACDAAVLRDIQLGLNSDGGNDRALGDSAAVEAGWDNDWEDLIGQCTNCARTNKRCTFEWVRSQQAHLLDRRSSVGDQSSSGMKSGTASLVYPQDDANALPDFLPPSVPSHLFDAASSYALAHSLANDDELLLEHFPADNTGLNSDVFLPQNTADASQGLVPTFADPPPSLATFEAGLPGQAPTFSNALIARDAFAIHPNPNSIHRAITAKTKAAKKNGKRRRSPSPLDAAGLVGIQGFGSDPKLARMASNSLVAENLMRIYHDVMEGALSCWLTERTCPYKALPVPSSNPTPTAAMESMKQEWGPNWTNRIYRRVFKLDRTSRTVGIKPLNLSEERKAGRALNLAIMAFTAQWAQASDRGRARYAHLANRSQAPSRMPEKEFDRTLQESFYNQARRCLDDCSDIDSFRVVFAEIIFGLTQKYFDADEVSRRHRRDRDTSPSKVIEEVLSQDGQPVYLERAARRLLVLKRRIETYERKYQAENLDPEASEPGVYDWEDRQTMGLLFWLAVMFDTISSAMTERPLAVADEESQDTVSIQHKSNALSTHDHGTKGWNDLFLKQLPTNPTSLRWPCPEDAIAHELANAAPVKVLLYRKVTRLQTLTARGASGTSIEESIEDAMVVYRHWNTLYSPLFQDCVEHHFSLPPRIQSWYVCLLGHWLLATLLLADSIEFFDEKKMSTEAKSRDRAATNLVGYLRVINVHSIADLARASTPRHDEFGNLPNFHTAVSEGALLTEPWTIILVRSFSRAGTMLLDGANAQRQRPSGFPESAAAETACSRCEDCVKALWYLGRKSDMARQVADILGGALQRTRARASGATVIHGGIEPAAGAIFREEH